MPADADSWPLISVCIPVKNGGSRLGRCLQSLRDLDYPQDRLEIIIADGRSTDDTVEVAKAFGSRVLDNPGQIVASGRNVAFSAAHNIKNRKVSRLLRRELGDKTHSRRWKNLSTWR